MGLYFRLARGLAKLSLPAREHFLSAPSHAATVAAEGYDRDVFFVQQAGLVEAISNGRLKPTRASVPFRSVMAQLAKMPLFDEKPTRERFDEYHRKHYLREEIDAVLYSDGLRWDTEAWPQAFVNHAKPKTWELKYLTPMERDVARSALSERFGTRQIHAQLFHAHESPMAVAQVSKPVWKIYATSCGSWRTFRACFINRSGHRISEWRTQSSI